MPKPFDAYHKWLGIPPVDQPPNHYRLLGINLFEKLPEVIESAADQRMVHLRSFQTGPNADDSQKLLNEVSVARVCLLKPETKARYDRLLKAKLAKAQPATKPPEQAADKAAADPPPVAAPLVAVSVGTAADATPAGAASFDFTSPAQPASGDWQADAMRVGSSNLRRKAIAKKKSSAPLMIAIGAPTALIVVGVAIFLAQGNRSNEASQTDASGSNQVAVAPVLKAKETYAGGVGSKDTRPVVFTNPSNLPPLHKNGQPGAMDPRPGTTTSPGVKARDPGHAGPGGTEPPEAELADIGISAADLARRAQLKMPTDDGSPQGTTGKNPAKKTPPKDTNVPGSGYTPGVGDHPATASGGADVKGPPTARRPVPDEAAQQKALQQLKDLLKDDYAGAKTPDAQIDLAHKLQQLAVETKSDPTSTYVMFAQALDLAAKGGDASLAMEVVDAMIKSFDVDAWDLRQKTLAQLAHGAKTEEVRSAIAHSALELAAQANSESRFDTALALCTTALNLAMAAKDNALRDQARELTERTKSLQKEQPIADLALQKLKTNPDDADANLVVGRLKCFLLGDWAAGLPFLSKGSDEALKALAKLELNTPSAAEDQGKLADAWWDQAEKKGEKKDDPTLKAMRARAIYWYRQALPNLTGLMLTKAQKRIDTEDAAKPDAPITETVYLDDLPEQDLTLANLSLGKHGDTGYTRNAGRPIVAGGGKKGKITIIPGAPPPAQRVVLGGVEAQHALSLQPRPNGNATVAYDVGGKYRLFNGTAALIDGANPQSAVLFRVLVDGKQIWVSRPMRRAGESQSCTLRIAKAKKLEFEILCNGPNAGAMTAWINPAVGR